MGPRRRLPAGSFTLPATTSAAAPSVEHGMGKRNKKLRNTRIGPQNPANRPARTGPLKTCTDG